MIYSSAYIVETAFPDKGGGLFRYKDTKKIRMIITIKMVVSKDLLSGVGLLWGSKNLLADTIIYRTCHVEGLLSSIVCVAKCFPELLNLLCEISANI